MKEFLFNPWTVAIGGAVIAGLILRYGFGIGKSDNKEDIKDKPFAFKVAEEEISFDEKLRSLKMDIVKVIAHDHTLGIRAEYAWMDNAYPNDKKFEQSLMKFEVDAPGDKKKVVTFDVHRIELQDGREKKIYFEIDSFFADGKPASFEQGYRDQKIKDIYSE